MKFPLSILASLLAMIVPASGIPAVRGLRGMRDALEPLCHAWR